PAAGTPSAPVPPTATPMEAAIGRPGAGLLVPAGTPAVGATPTPTPFATATRGRLPSATSRPLLPRPATATPAPPRGGAAGLLEWLSTLLGLTGP
ncbi:MAG: hypothetical protein ACP5UQ_17655, partial [Anaerolineae bacterium]